MYRAGSATRYPRCASVAEALDQGTCISGSRARRGDDRGAPTPTNSSAPRDRAPVDQRDSDSLPTITSLPASCSSGAASAVVHAPASASNAAPSAVTPGPCHDGTGVPRGAQEAHADHHVARQTRSRRRRARATRTTSRTAPVDPGVSGRSRAPPERAEGAQGRPGPRSRHLAALPPGKPPKTCDVRSTYGDGAAFVLLTAHPGVTRAMSAAANVPIDRTGVRSTLPAREPRDAQSPARALASEPTAPGPRATRSR